jgi:hypothetical protein
MTLGTLSDDLFLRLTKSAPTDDFELEETQVMYLLAQERDNIVKQYLDAQIKAAQPLETQYKDRVAADTLEIEDDALIVVDDERMYVEVPHQPLPLINDMGIMQVLTQEYLPVDRFRVENFTIYQNLRFAKASPKHLCWYRDGRKCIIKGLTQKNRENDKFVVDYFPAIASQTLTRSTDIKLSDALLPMLTGNVEVLLRRQVYETVQDVVNDGIQAPQ